MKIKMTIEDQIAICERAIETLQTNKRWGLCQCLYTAIAEYYKSLGHNSLAVNSFANTDIINPYYAKVISNSRWRKIYVIAEHYSGFRSNCGYWFPSTYAYVITRINVLQDFIEHLKTKLNDIGKD